MKKLLLSIMALMVAVTAAAEIEVLMSPANGSEQQYIDELLFAFRNVETVTIDNEKEVYMTDGNVKVPYWLTHGTDMEGGYMTVVCNPQNQSVIITESGTWTLYVEKGGIIVDGEPYDVDYKLIIPDFLRKPTSIPAEGDVEASQLNEVTLLFTDNVEVNTITGWVNNYGATTLKEYDPLGHGKQVGSYFATIDAEKKNIVHLTLTLNEGETLKTGEYSISLPASMFNTNIGTNLAWSLKYNVVSDTSGIVGIEGDGATTFNVFTIGGVQVVNNGSSEQIGSLSKGMYIINGKKVLKK